METNTSNTVGRPPLTSGEVDGIFRKLEPHLRTGLSFNKACLVAQIPKSTFYDLYDKNPEFSEKIDSAKCFYSVTVSSIVHQELCRIQSKQNLGVELNAQEMKFVQWVAVTSTNTKEEFGREDAQIRRDEQSTNQGLTLLQTIVNEHERENRAFQHLTIKSNALDI